MGEVINIKGAYSGRSWQFNEDEDAALEYLPHVDQVLYLRGLRKFMDFATGIVGIRRKVSYQMFRELLEVHRRRGSTKPEYYPKRDEVRASLTRLEAAGLIIRVPSASKAVADSMVFKLPFAHADLTVLSNEERQGQTLRATTPQDSVLAGAGDSMSPSCENAMNNTPPYIRISEIKEIRENSSELSHSASQDSVILKNSKAVNQDTKSKQASSKQSSLGVCPHHEVLELWAKYFPGKSQPNKNLWDQQTASQHLKARWREVSMIMHSTGTRTLYATREEGLQWWGEFFQYISVRCLFLMSDDSQFFNLAWLVKKANFMKTLDQNYEVRK